jgi:hypothetical protein
LFMYMSRRAFQGVAKVYLYPLLYVLDDLKL